MITQIGKSWQRSSYSSRDVFPWLQASRLRQIFLPFISFRHSGIQARFSCCKHQQSSILLHTPIGFLTPGTDPRNDTRRTYCAYYRINQLNWRSKYQQEWSFGANITNIGVGLRGGSGGQFRGSRTRCSTKILTNIRVHTRDCMPKNLVKRLVMQSRGILPK